MIINIGCLKLGAYLMFQVAHYLITKYPYTNINPLQDLLSKNY